MVQTGGKTLLFHDLPRINKDNIDKELDPILRRIMDILEELNRRQYDLGKAITYPLFLATYLSNAAGEPTGWYNCTIAKFNSDGSTGGQDDGLVLNLVEQFHDDELTDELPTAQQYICWRITSGEVAIHRYVGVEVFGRATIGRCV